MEMYSTHKQKSVVAKRFIRVLKNKICKYMTSVSKNVYINKLDEIIDKCNNAYHRSSEVKPVDLKPSKENNEEVLKFKVGDHVRI